jgi:NAD(P)-dependent dehydrogenase (short-subunit alcohol dehydrogenase family)
VGKGIAEELAREGFLVIVTSRHEAEAVRVAEGLAGKGDHYQVDFADPAQIAGLFAYIEKQYGRLDVLVNNVAFTQNESILDCTLEIWEKTINTNLRSYYLCIQHAAGLMQKQGGGNIVNITVGGLGNNGGKNKFAYTVSKGGVNFMTKCAATDLAPLGIRVNAVSIGLTGTPVGSKEYTGRKRNYANPDSLAGHIGAPQDVANAVAFLVSDKASFIYSAMVPVDGGFGR